MTRSTNTGRGFEKLRRFRRTAWAAVAIGFLVQIASAPAHPTQPQHAPLASHDAACGCPDEKETT